MIFHHGRCGLNPVKANNFSTEGTRRIMSSNPGSYALSYGTYSIDDVLLMRSFTFRARFSIVISSVLPTLVTSPTDRSVSIKRISASTVSRTSQKQRDCCPVPKMLNGVLPNADFTKFGNTIP